MAQKTQSSHIFSTFVAFLQLPLLSNVILIDAKSAAALSAAALFV